MMIPSNKKINFDTENPVEACCQFCHNVVVTRVESKRRMRTWSLCGKVICMCIKSFKEFKHFCPNCGALVGKGRERRKQKCPQWRRQFWCYIQILILPIKKILFKSVLSNDFSLIQLSMYINCELFLKDFVFLLTPFILYKYTRISVFYYDFSHRRLNGVKWKVSK